LSNPSFVLQGGGSAYGGYSGSWSASASLTLLIQAPVGAHLRLQVNHSSTLTLTNPWSAGGTANVTVTAAGQSYSAPTATNHTGSMPFSAVVPAGGLPVTISFTENLSFAGFPGSFLAASTATTLSLQWSYPGVSDIGGPSPGCAGPADCWTNGSPVAGTAGFGLSCVGAHPNSTTAFALGVAALPVPAAVGGMNIWINPAQPYVTGLRPTNAIGSAFYALPIPATASVVGLSLFGQCLSLEPPGCKPMNLSASNAMRLVVQP
jgi:hypothetical protein